MAANNIALLVAGTRRIPYSPNFAPITLELHRFGMGSDDDSESCYSPDRRACVSSSSGLTESSLSYGLLNFISGDAVRLAGSSILQNLLA